MAPLEMPAAGAELRAKRQQTPGMAEIQSGVGTRPHCRRAVGFSAQGYHSHDLPE